MNIRTKDLNLLAPFLTICEELNLSRAAERLGLSQPALSHALSRMRGQFADPLFVRAQRGLVATPRVKELLPQVRQILDLAYAVYGGGPAFDPANVRRNVVIASTAYFESRTVVALVQQLNRMAPGLRVETRSLIGGFPARELESGEFDLAIAAYFENPPRSFRIRTVFKDRFVCVCSKTNAYVRTRRTTADFLGRKHLQIEVPPGVFAPVDRYLTLKKKRREISLRIGNFLTPPAILEGSDLLLTCPSHLAQSYAGMYPLAITELPFPLPGITTKMIWHERNHRDAFHTWLRDAVSQPSESH